MDSQQELFTKLKLSLEALGFAVYDGFLPPDGTAYPFVYLGDSRQDENATKSAVCGSVYQTIHIWSDSPTKRGTLSKMLLQAKEVCRSIKHTANFAWIVANVNQRIIADNTTKTPLLHGVLEVEFKFS